MTVSVRVLQDAERGSVAERLRERWGDEIVIARGMAHDASLLLGFIAEEENECVGLATYEIRGGECELVTLDSYREGTGVGSALLAAIGNVAYGQGCKRLVVVTTNDNVAALGFYQRHGFVLTALRSGAVSKARLLKPSIPELGRDGIQIRDELEL